MSGLDTGSIGAMAQVSTGSKIEVDEYRTRREGRTGRTAFIKAVTDKELLSLEQMKTFLSHRCDAKVGVNRAEVKYALDEFMQANHPNIFLKLLAAALPNYYTRHVVAENFVSAYNDVTVGRGAPLRHRVYCYAPELGDRDFTNYVNFELAEDTNGVFMFIHVTRLRSGIDSITHKVVFMSQLPIDSDAMKMLVPLLEPDSPQQESYLPGLLVEMCHVVAAADICFSRVYQDGEDEDEYDDEDVSDDEDYPVVAGAPLPVYYRDFLVKVLHALIIRPAPPRPGWGDKDEDGGLDLLAVVRAAFTDFAVK